MGGQSGTHGPEASLALLQRSASKPGESQTAGEAGDVESERALGASRARKTPLTQFWLR